MEEVMMKTKIILCIFLLVFAAAAGLGGVAHATTPPTQPYSEITPLYANGTWIGWQIEPTGIDDQPNIEWAMSNLTPGGTVLLNGSEFKLSRTVDAVHFSGTLKGLGREVTTIHLLDNYGFSALAFKRSRVKMPWAFLLNYDPFFERPYTGDANLTVSDFRIVADGSTRYVWREHGARSKSCAGITIVGGSFNAPYETPTGLNTRLERLEIVGTPNDNSDGFHRNLSNIFWPINLVRIHGGHHTLKDVRFESTGYHLFWNGFECTVEVSDIEAESTTAFGGDVAPLRFAWNNKCTIHVERLNTVEASGIQVITGGDLFYSPLIPLAPSTYFFEHCDIQQPSGSIWACFELVELLVGADKSSFVITKNTITVNDPVPPYGPFFTYNVDGAAISNNKIKGTSLFGFYMEPFSFDGDGSGQGCTFVGNNMEQFTPTIASYLLAPGTSNYTLVGHVQDNVLDLGTNNTLVGVNNMNTQLGQDVKDAMMEQKDAKKQLNEMEY